MYEEFFGLRDLPFELTANARFLVMTVGHREAYSVLQHGVQSRKSVTLLIGDAGTGKSTLIDALLKALARAHACFVFINNPRLTRDELIETVAAGFGLSSEAGRSKAAMLREIEPLLKSRAAEGRLTALIVDEAQCLSDDLLEEIRLLANMEADSTKLLPVVLAGQPELADRLNQPGLRQLKQRVSLRSDLMPLTQNETASYITRRARAAGGDPGVLFTREAVAAIHQVSGGIPRLVNTLCDNALMAGFAASCRPIRREVIREVSADLGLSPAIAPAAQSVTPRVQPAPPPLAIENHAIEVGVDARVTDPRRLSRILGLS